MTKPDSSESTVTEYEAIVVLVKRYKVTDTSDMNAHQQVAELVQNEVPDDSGWHVEEVNFQRKKTIPVC